MANTPRDTRLIVLADIGLRLWAFALSVGVEHD